MCEKKVDDRFPLGSHCNLQQTVWLGVQESSCDAHSLNDAAVQTSKGSPHKDVDVMYLIFKSAKVSSTMLALLLFPVFLEEEKNIMAWSSFWIYRKQAKRTAGSRLFGSCM